MKKLTLILIFFVSSSVNSGSVDSPDSEWGDPASYGCHVGSSLTRVCAPYKLDRGYCGDSDSSTPNVQFLRCAIDDDPCNGQGQWNQETEKCDVPDPDPPSCVPPRIASGGFCILPDDEDDESGVGEGGEGSGGGSGGASDVPEIGGEFTGPETQAETIGVPADLVVDSDGAVWEKSGGSLCDNTGRCVAEYRKTDTVVDPVDHTTWPDGATSAGGGGPFGYIPPDGQTWDPTDPDYVDPFKNPSIQDDFVVDKNTKTEVNNETGTTKTTEEETRVDKTGVRTNTKTETETNSDGSKVTKVTVTRNDNNGRTVTTTTSKTDTGGTTTVTGTSTESDQGNDEGETGSVTGGVGCENAPGCDGDPILCAILHQQWETRCTLDQDYAAQLVDLKASNPTPATNENGSLSSLAPIENNVTDLVDFGFLTSMSDPLSGSSCPADLTETIASGAVSFSFLPFCDLASGMRPLVILIALFTSAGILFRGVTSS